MLDTSPVVSIWLEMSINWHTKSQGPKKKCDNFSRGRINPWPAHTARNKGSFTPYTLRSVESFFSPTVYPITPVWNWMQEVARIFQHFYPKCKIIWVSPLFWSTFKPTTKINFFALKPAVQSHFTGKWLGLEEIFISQIPFRIWF